MQTLRCYGSALRGGECLPPDRTGLRNVPAPIHLGHPAPPRPDWFGSPIQSWRSLRPPVAGDLEFLNMEDGTRPTPALLPLWFWAHRLSVPSWGLGMGSDHETPQMSRHPHC